MPIKRPTKYTLFHAIHPHKAGIHYFRTKSLLAYEQDDGMLNTADSITRNGTVLYASSYFKTYMSFKAYLTDRFSEQMVDRLLPRGFAIYCENEAKLYGPLFVKGPEDPPTGAEYCRVTKESDTLYAVTVTTEILDPDTRTLLGHRTLVHEYRCIDGKWVFTTFPQTTLNGT